MSRLRNGIKVDYSVVEQSFLVFQEYSLAIEEHSFVAKEDYLTVQELSSTVEEDY